MNNKNNDKTLKDLGIKFPFRDSAISMAMQNEQQTFDLSKLLGLEKKRRKDPWFQQNAKKLKEEPDNKDEVNSAPITKSCIALVSTSTTSTAQISDPEASQLEFSVMKEQCELKVVELFNQIEAIRLLLNEKKTHNFLVLNEVLEKMAAEIDDNPVNEVSDVTSHLEHSSTTLIPTSQINHSFPPCSPNMFLDPFQFEDPFSDININSSQEEDLFQSNSNCLI